MNKLNYKYETLTPFKICVLENFPFIEADFDALTNYQIMCKIVEYLNQTRNNQNIVQENIIALNNWFNNLDITDEINTKLDNMVKTGELQTLLNAQYNALREEVNISIRNFENNVNDTIAEQNNKINSLKNYEPIVVDSISKMTDRTKVYLLTTDSNWYYFNGTSWEIGGSYNGTAIANGSIDILKFDNLLYDSFDINFNPTIELNDGYLGYVTNRNGILTITQNDGYKYYIVDLELGAIYNYVGHSRYLAQGLVIADSENNVIFNTSGNEMDNVLIKINQTGLKAYIGEQLFTHPTNADDTFDKFNQANLFRKVDSIYSKVIINNSVQKIQTLTNMASFTKDLNAPLKMRSIESYETLMFPMERGVTYNIKYSDRFLLSGLLITDNKYNLIYVGEEHQYPLFGELEYTATTDGFIFLLKFEDFVPTISKLTAGIEVISDGIYNILKGKTIIYDGDSITQSRINQGNQSNGGAYPKIIADITKSNYINNARGGATLSYKNNQTSHCISRELTSLPTNGDAYVLSGGINDLWDNRPLGTITDNYTDDVDDTTITGALEKIFRYAITNFVGKPIIFVITQKISEPYTLYNGINQFDLHDRLVEVCNKYSIPYYDAFNDSGLNGWNSVQKETYLNSNSSGTGDGTHPNELGYKKYYVPQIIDILNKNLLK